MRGNSSNRTVIVITFIDPGGGGGQSIVKNTGSGWLDILGSEILVGKIYFGVLQIY